MNILIFKENFQGVSVHHNGISKVTFADPASLETDYDFGKPDYVFVGKELETEHQRLALLKGFQLTDYKEGKKNKVVLI